MLKKKKLKKIGNVGNFRKSLENVKTSFRKLEIKLNNILGQLRDHDRKIEEHDTSISKICTQLGLELTEEITQVGKVGGSSLKEELQVDGEDDEDDDNWTDISSGDDDIGSNYEGEDPSKLEELGQGTSPGAFEPGTSGQRTSGEKTSGQGSSGQGTSGQVVSGERTSGERISGKGTSGQGTSGEKISDTLEKSKPSKAILTPEVLNTNNASKNVPSADDSENEEYKEWKRQNLKGIWNEPENISENKSSQSGKRPYECEFCGRKFGRKQSLLDHAYVHSNGTGKYECPICKRKFVYKVSLVAHLDKDKKHCSSFDVMAMDFFVCGDCGMEFRWEHQLKRHSRAHAVSRPREFKCPTCGDKFAHRSSLRRHQGAIHDRPTNNPVKRTLRSEGKEVVDPKRFKEVRILCERIDVSKYKISGAFPDPSVDPPHSEGEGRLTCSRESDSEILQVPENTSPEDLAPEDPHAEDPYLDDLTPEDTDSEDAKPFLCQICDQTFEVKSELEEHSRSHTSQVYSKTRPDQEPPTKCSICNLQYHHTDAWKRHMRGKHLNEPLPETKSSPFYYRNSYKCPACDNRLFYVPYLWKRHMRNKHSDTTTSLPTPRKVFTLKPYVCPICKKRFSTRTGSGDHLSIQHPKAPSGTKINFQPGPMLEVEFEHEDSIHSIGNEIEVETCSNNG